VASLPGEPVVPPSYSWHLEWQPVAYAVSGTFDAEVIDSPYNPTVSRLQLSNLHLTTDAPASAGFALPLQLSIAGGGVVHISDRACEDDGFYWTAGTTWSCTGGNTGPISSHSGTFGAGRIALAGGKSWPFMGFGSTNSPTMPPPVTDYSPVAGLYEYSIQAVAVPEPASSLMILGGLGVLALVRRRQVRRQPRSASD
jgi:hypothetical protein